MTRPILRVRLYRIASYCYGITTYWGDDQGILMKRTNVA